MKLSATLALVLCCAAATAQTHYVRFATPKGNITVMLYDDTPLHRDNFLSGIKTGMFKNAAFNRVIKSFVSQGGELDQTIEDREKLHPDLPQQRVAAEIVPRYFHKKGALGAGRNDNVQKNSFVDQIYFVAGKVQSDEQLDKIERKRGVKFPEAQRSVYKTMGGTPQLDGNYTIFGEIVQGLDVAEALNSVATDKSDLPLESLKFKLTELNRREIARLKALN